MQDHLVVKVVLDIPKIIPELRKLFEQNAILCYEADIRFTQQFLIDHGILRSMDIEGEFTTDAFVSRIYHEPTLTPVDWYPELRVLSIDIETSMDGKQLYCIGLSCLSDHYRNESLVVSSEEKLKRAKIFPDEKSLLEHFRQEIIIIDPDIITGWNVIDFDLAFLRKKFEQYKIPFQMARRNWDCTLRIESSFMKESTAEFPGRQVLDGINLLKINFIRLDDYKLGTAAAEFLGEGKLIGNGNKGKDIEDAYKHNLQKLIDYNLKDTELVLGILKKTNVIDIMINRTMLTGMSLERVRGSVASFDSLYLRELHHAAHVASSSKYTAKEEQIGGGYVMQSQPGIYENIIVLDFKSLYPSIMRTFCIDPLGHEQACLAQSAKEKKIKEKNKKPNIKNNEDAAHRSDKNIIFAPNDAPFMNDKNAILPSIIRRLWSARDEAKKRKDAFASQAIKTLMNSFFGVLANPGCRFFSMDVANAITSFGRHLIQLSMRKIEEMGHVVIYGDTDSIFVNANCNNYADAERISKEIERSINVFYAQHIREEYHCISAMELEVDKIFLHFLMPKVRGSEEGAKKRYAGIVLDNNGHENLDVTGLEIVRRDWTDLAKKFQMELLQLVFKKEDPVSFVKELIQQLRDGKLDDQLVYRKAIRKELEGYTKTTPPHVKAARKLEENGVALTSTLIEYVMTTDGPEPLQLMNKKTKIDYEYYIEKQLKPIGDGILFFFDTTFDDIVQGHSQRTLFGFS